MDSEVKAALFDIDGTLTHGGAVWDPLLKSARVSSWRKLWLYSTAMPHHILSKTGLVSQSRFRDRWVRLMAWLMTGWTQQDVLEVCRSIVWNRLIPDLRADVVAILKEHRQHHRIVLLVSTMPHLVVELLAEHLGANAGLGTTLAIVDGHATGRVVGSPCAGARKVQRIEDYFREHQIAISLSECAAYADSASDIPLLAAAGFPTAIYPDTAMRAAAIRAGWPVFAGH